jgi:predicted secreted protein
MKYVLVFIALLAIVPLSANAQNRKDNRVELRTNEAKKSVDVLIDGALFTTYRWDDDLKKPILYPTNTARGTVITRGFPIEPRAGESVDHPHQSGLWLNYGDVNGVDFWNNSIYRTPDELKHLGTIVHRRIVSAKGGKSSGELSVEADWIMPHGKTILREATTYIFHSGVDSRTIDRITTLTAPDHKVVFKDSKEGMFGLRVRRELEQPATEPILVTDRNAKPSTKKLLDNTNASGEFRSSEGKSGDAVWGTRAKWALLAGHVGDEAITIAIFDNPANAGFPAYWMARGYGLFAINPLGRRAYDNKEPLNLTLEPGSPMTFLYRVLILSKKATDVEIETRYQEFIRQVK